MIFPKSLSHTVYTKQSQISILRQPVTEYKMFQGILYVFFKNAPKKQYRNRHTKRLVHI